MKKPTDILRLAKKTVTDPAGAVADLALPGADVIGPVSIYLAYSALYALFLYLKPSDFPADLAETAAEFSGRSYLWLFTAHTVLELVFAAAFCAVLPVFVLLLSGGRLALRFLSSVAACGVYGAAAFYFKDSPLFALLFFAAAAALSAAGFRAKGSAARALFIFSLAANAAVIICLPLIYLALKLRSENFYLAAEAAAGLWITLLMITAAKTAFAAAAARTVLALLFSMTATVLSFYILKNVGIIPGEIFRFMMFM